jgi:hypothetical protein
MSKPGALLSALSPASAYSARKTDLWPDLMDRLAGCLIPSHVDAFEQHVVSLGLALPVGWQELIDEQVEKRREEIASEDITAIMRERFDF